MDKMRTIIKNGGTKMRNKFNSKILFVKGFGLAKNS